MNVNDAIKNRISTRAYLDKPLPTSVIENILETARWAPSGTNTQPWQVAVVSGASKNAITKSLIKAWKDGDKPDPDYDYYPKEWIEPFKKRRFDCGMALYSSLDIKRDDTDKRNAVWQANYEFFNAPVTLFFFIDRVMEKGSWFDMGMFVQNVMLAAEEQGLGTCPQASTADYPNIVRKELGMDDQYALICGLSIGYPDPNAAINQYRTTREDVSSFTHYHD